MYVPSKSEGFCVAITIKGLSRSIVFESDKSDKSGGAYTFHHITEGYSQSRITASGVKGSGSDLINSDYKNEDFYSVEVFKPKNGSLLIEEDTPLVTSITAQGQEKKMMY